MHRTLKHILKVICLLGMMLVGQHFTYADDTTNIYDMIAERAISTPMNGNFSGPTAPLNNLPPQQKSCMFLCGMGFEAPGPAARRSEEMQTCFSACYAKSLDVGTAERERYQNVAMEHYAKAKDLGSQFPPPTFEK